jgi:glycosyltransferase involved in cell wall biosynthesis
MDLTLIIPVYNEVENLERLITEIHAALDGRELQYELLFIDDGSRDGSFDLLRRLQADDARLVILRFRRNSGQTAAFAAGFDHAQGRILVTLDADGQNDPADIPALLDKLAEGYDVVNGWRQKRQDRYISRRLPSYLANQLIALVTQVELHDRGCSLRAFRAEAAQELRLYGEMHRFIPELLAAAGFEMAEVPVNHRPRTAGRSKYGLSRTLRVLLDLLTVFFIRRYGDRPMHLLGTAGLIFGGLGGLIAALLSSGKIWAGIAGGLDAFHAYRLADRPLLLLAVLLVILGSQFLVMGLLAELGVRTYYESQNKPVYHLKDILRHGKEA